MSAITPSEASRRLAALYSAAALDYARYWAPVLLPMARPLLDELPLATATRALDLGCGTGDLLRDLRAAAPRASVLGADRARGALEVARVAGHTLVETDASRLALRSASFDVVVLAFVLFHMPDPPAALCEVRRVLSRRGKAGIVAWGASAELPGHDLWQQELDLLGAGPDPRDPEVAKHEWMDTPEKLSSLARAAGFVSVRSWTRVFERRWAHDALLETQCHCGTPARRLATLAPREQEECRRRVGARLARLKLDELVYRPEVVYAVAGSDE